MSLDDDTRSVVLNLSLPNGSNAGRHASLIKVRKISPTERAIALRVFPGNHKRPQKRSECVGGIRPCPYVGCRHHLYLEVTEPRKGQGGGPGGDIRLNFPGLDPDELDESCSLDVVADRVEVTSDEAGDLLGITRQMAERIEHVAVNKLMVSGCMSDWRDHDPEGNERPAFARRRSKPN